VNLLASLSNNVVSLWSACNAESHTLGGMLSVLSAGTGLYLGLAVIQVVGAGRVATLRRRVDSVRNLVNKNSLTNCSHISGNLEAKLLTAEISLETLSSVLFAISLMLLCVCLFIIFGATVFHSYEIECYIVVGIGVFCLLLPLLIFVVSSLVIRLKTNSAARQVSEASVTVKTALAKRHS